MPGAIDRPTQAGVREVPQRGLESLHEWSERLIRGGRERCPADHGDVRTPDTPHQLVQQVGGADARGAGHEHAAGTAVRGLLERAAEHVPTRAPVPRTTCDQAYVGLRDTSRRARATDPPREHPQRAVRRGVALLHQVPVDDRLPIGAGTRSATRTRRQQAAATHGPAHRVLHTGRRAGARPVRGRRGHAPGRGDLSHAPARPGLRDRASLGRHVRGRGPRRAPRARWGGGRPRGPGHR